MGALGLSSVGAGALPFGAYGRTLDLVCVGSYSVFANTKDGRPMLSLETAIQLEIGNGVTIKHVSAPAFLAQKWAAHHDRGRDDPLTSHDLEDILALLASRPGIAEEVAAAPPPRSARMWGNRLARSWTAGRPKTSSPRT